MGKQTSHSVQASPATARSCSFLDLARFGQEKNQRPRDDDGARLSAPGLREHPLATDALRAAPGVQHTPCSHGGPSPVEVDMHWYQSCGNVECS